MFIHTSVADDVNAVDGCRFAFVHTHLEIDGVILNCDFDGLHAEEEVTLVGIEFCHGIVVLL